MTVDVSIIVPIFNVEKYLTRCIVSILNQTHNNFELILINDGSQDNCGEICEKFSLKDKRVKVIHQENQGVGQARNNGLAVAKGKYIYFCDPDDFIEPTLLEDNFYFAEKYQANMVVFGYWDEKHNSSGQESAVARSCNSVFLESKKDFRQEFEMLFKQNMMYTLWNKLYRREYLKKSNCTFSNKKIGEDTIFNYCVYEKLDRVFCNEKLYYHYITNRAGAATNHFKANKFEMRYEETSRIESLIKKWGYSEKYNQLIQEDWAWTLLHGANNLMFEDCPYDDKEKKKQLEEMISEPNIRGILKDIPIDNIEGYFSKALILSLKYRKTAFALNLLKLKSFIKKIA